MPQLQIGTARARPGEIVTGWFDAVSLPTGGMDQFPIMIAQGKQADGPVMWVTSGIHGGEHTGVVTIHQLMTEQLVASLRGTVIAVPALSPGGLRTKQRLPYYLQTDPNRLWPRPDRRARDVELPSPAEKPRHELELAYQRLYEAIVETQPACLFDLHNAWFGSIPFAFRDPVFYRKSRGPGIKRRAAERLQARVGEMLDAFGFTVINEFVADDYVTRSLHRSVSGSLLNGAQIPSATIELGSWMHVDPHVVFACVCGLKNVMHWLNMLPGEPERIEGIRVMNLGYPVRRHVSPYAPKTGIAHHLLRPGDLVREGDPLVRLTDIFGKPLLEDDGLIRSEYNGFVMAWHHGVVHYQGDPIMDLAIRDDNHLIVPYPE